MLMATFSGSFDAPSPSFFIFFLLILVLTTSLRPTFSLSFPSLLKSDDSAAVTLIGDAHFANAESTVQLTRSMPSSSGLVLQNKPFKFLDPNSIPISFSTDFTFTISPHSGDGLALVIVPTDFGSKFSRESSFGLSRGIRFLGIEFDTSMDENVGDENGNHVGVDVGSLVSVKVSNVSMLNLVLNSGDKLHSWVDYDASSKRLEVRLSKWGGSRPYNPMLTYSIDLSEMWKNEEVLVGISSSTGNSLQTSCVHSWSFRIRRVPKWLHSQPLNPHAVSNERVVQKTAHKKNICVLRFFSGLIYAVGFGVIAAFVVLFLREIFGNIKDAVVSAERSCQSDLRYEKIDVVENKAVKN